MEPTAGHVAVKRNSNEYRDGTPARGGRAYARSHWRPLLASAVILGFPPMPPRSWSLNMAGETQIAAIIREFRDAIGQAENRILERVREVSAEARQAREGVIAINSTLEGQDLAAQLESVRSEVKGLRSDIVNANSRTKAELGSRMDGLEARVTNLERSASQTDGKWSLVGWLLRYAPWIAGPVLGAMAAMGVEKRF